MGFQSISRHPLTVSIGIHGLLLALILFGFVWSGWLASLRTDNAKNLTWIEVEMPQSKRVVQSVQGEKVDKAAKDALLGKQTQIVDRQVVARTKSFQEAPSRAKPQARAPEQTKAEKKVQALSKLKQFGLPILPEQRNIDLSRAPAQARGPYQAGQEKAAMDSTPAGEYIKGLKESEVTALNTREYVFFGFFQRIRERLDLAWSRLLYEHLSRISRQGRRIASERDHTTRLLVVMNAEGKITRVKVLEESGTIDLDDAAVKAFNQAGPFPNPPKGLVDSTGSIEIRWDFILRT